MENKRIKRSVYDTVLVRRTIRKFVNKKIDDDIILRLVNSARVAPSAANLQPIEYFIVNEERLKSELFKLLNWAAYIKPEGNPKPGEEPAAYIVFLVNMDIARGDYYKIDCGLSAENLILAALEEGIGSCIHGSFSKSEVIKLLNIKDKYQIEFIIAIGYPAEDPIMEEAEDDSIRYFKDSSGRLHVPKKKIENIIHFNSF